MSEPVFYGYLVYKFKRIVGKPNFSDPFKNENQVGYKIDIMKQCTCLVLNPFTVYSYVFLLNWTMVGQASDAMKSPT